MQAELIMDGNDDDLVLPNSLKPEAEKRLRKSREKPSVSKEGGKEKASRGKEK